MKKEDISDLSQAADEEIDFVVTIAGVPLNDVADALFVIYSLGGEEQVKLTLGSGITFNAGVLTVSIGDTYSTTLVGAFKYELWVKDSQGIDTPLNYGTLKFKPTFGRY